MGLPEPYQSQFEAKTQEFEGRTNYLYADSRGNPTCGIGHMVPSGDAAIALPFSGGNPAEDWHAVKIATVGRVAAFYAHLTTSRLPDDAINVLFAQDCDAAFSQIRSFLPSFDALPPTV